jgi:hypothetical protein
LRIEHQYNNIDELSHGDESRSPLAVSVLLLDLTARLARLLQLRSASSGDSDPLLGEAL